MLAAKKGRQEQLKVIEAYERGETVVFKNHQGNEWKAKYDPSVFEKPHTSKLDFTKDVVFLDAAAQSDCDTVTKMLGEGQNPNTANADGLTALHQCVIEGSLKVASALVMNGADVNARDNDWWTPLHAAAACGHWRIANFLLSNGADVTAVNADGDLAIDIVEGEKTGEVIEAEMTRLGYTEDKFEELRDGPRKHLAEMVDKMLKDKADLNAKDANGATPLHAATCAGYLDIMTTLLDNGADIHAVDDEGNTPLHMAAFFLQYRAAELLGKRGANIDARNRFDQAPIVLSEDATMIRLLKAIKSQQTAGVDLNVKSPKALGSVKRKTLSDRSILGKADHAAEHKVLEKIEHLDDASNYATLDFGDKEAETAAPEKEECVEYAAIDYSKTAKNKDDDEEQPSDEAAAMYAVPKKTRKEGSSKKATETEAEPADSTIAKKASKKLGQSVERKASLAAIAMEEQAASDSAGNGVDEVAKEPSEAQPKPCKEPEPSKEKKKGGCCVVQ